MGNSDFDAMVRTLREVRIMSDRLVEFSYYYNRALRQLSNTPVALMSLDPFLDDFKHARVGIPMGSLFSIIMLLDGESIKVNNFGKDFFKFGINFKDATNKLVENYYYSVDSMPKTADKPFYTKSEILENALALTPASALNDLMRKTFGVKPNSHDVAWPPRSDFGYDTCAFKRKLDIARDFVMLNRNLFRMADAFYYAPGRERSAKYNDILKEYFVLPDASANSPNLTLEWNDVVTKLQTEEMTNLLRDARRKRWIIKFNIPVKVDFVRGYPVGNEQLAPINFKKDGSAPVSIGTLPIYYRDEEEYLRRELNSNAVIEDPDWLVRESDVPVILYAENNPNQLIHTGFEVFVEGYKVIDIMNEMVFVARNL